MKKLAVRTAAAAAGIGVGGFFLWWALRGTDANQVWMAATEADALLLLTATAVATFGFLIRALRWRVLLEPVLPGVQVGPRFAAVTVGFMVNNVLPWRLGEIARALALSRLVPVGFASGLGSLVAERALDMMVLFLLLLVPFAAGGFPAEGTLSSGTGAAIFRGALVGFGLMFGATVVLIALPRTVMGAGRAVERRLFRNRDAGWRAGAARVAARALHALADFLGAIRALSNPGVLARSLAWSFLFWTWNGLSFQLGMLAFGIETGMVSALFTEAVVGWFSAIPGPPGFVGNFHAAVKFALADIYGADQGSALGFAFAYHVAGWIPVTAIGLYYAVRIGLTKGRPSETARRD